MLVAVNKMKRAFSSCAYICDKVAAIWWVLKAVWEVKEKGEMFIEILTLLLSDLTFWEIVKIVSQVTVVVAVAFGYHGVASHAATITLDPMADYDEFEQNLSNLLNLCKMEEISKENKVRILNKL